MVSQKYDAEFVVRNTLGMMTSEIHLCKKSQR